MLKMELFVLVCKVSEKPIHLIINYIHLHVDLKVIERHILQVTDNFNFTFTFFKSTILKACLTFEKQQHLIECDT